MSQSDTTTCTSADDSSDPPKAQRRIESHVGYTRTETGCALDGCDGVYLQSQADSERVCHVCQHAPDREEHRRHSSASSGGHMQTHMFAAARWRAFWDERRAIRTDESRDERPYCVGGFKAVYKQ